MPNENSTSSLAEPSVPAAVPDNSDRLDQVGQFVLTLIRQTAGLARDASQDEQNPGASPKDRIEALEARIGQYRDMERQTALCGTLLTETQRKLRDRSEEANASYRKFVDAAALLQTANEEIFNLRKALQDKDRELSELRRESLQMISYMRLLVEMIDEKRSGAGDGQPAITAMN
jgi:predicted RNase H-like nuclease (RuvC/YqgF family)